MILLVGDNFILRALPIYIRALQLQVVQFKLYKRLKLNLNQFSSVKVK
jgi:hypothetical protein